MASVLPITPQHCDFTQTATVQGSSAHTYQVVIDQGIVDAQLAFSCLVKPQAGDIVLLNCGEETHYILAILSRPSSANMALNFPGDIALQANNGNIRIASKDKLLLASGGKTQIVNTELDVTSAHTKVHTDQLSISGDKAVCHWREVRSIANAVHWVADHITQKFKNSVKLVEGTDQQSSGNVLQTIKKSLTLRANHAVITAQKDIKIDGKRIHMG